MKIGSLFAGIGGLELGLERAIPGAETIWQVEKDPYARRVLAKHWPAAKRYEDVRQVGAHNLERPCILAGGFPCQDISNAGKKAGIDGERSGLWSEFARIIGEIRPRYVVLENVAAVVNRGMGRVLGQLAACGYNAVWDCIPAAAIGAPHLRDRWFCVAWNARHVQPTSGAISNAFRDGLREQSRRRIFWQEWQGPSEPGNHGAAESLADSQRQTFNGRNRQQWGRSSSEKTSGRGESALQGGVGTVTRRNPSQESAGMAAERFGGAHREERPPLLRGELRGTPEPGLGLGSDGLSAGMDRSGIAPWEQGIPRTVQGKLPDRVARLRCLGNAVVPQVAEVVGRVVWQIEQSTEREQ